MTSQTRPLALVTGASSGIGLELAKCCAERGYDLVIAADRPLADAVRVLREMGAGVEAIEADLATEAGVDRFLAAAVDMGRPIEVLCANAGHGLGKGFLDQDFDEIRHVIDTNVTGTVYLLHKVGRGMRERGDGHILIVGSIAGYMPGTFQAVYNATKAFVDSFAMALRAELDGSGVSVTCLMPGPTDTEFFARADMLDTKLARGKKDDPGYVAKVGFEAMLRGDGDIVSGWKNRLQAMLATVTPAGMLAEQHRKQAAPGSGHR
jgi:uncharacterized protein